MKIKYENLPESRMINQSLLRLADAEVRKDVESCIENFVAYRNTTVKLLTKENVSRFKPEYLNSLFDNTAMLAGGRESNFVHTQYKVLLLQLSFQLGFSYIRYYPDDYMGKIIQTKMNHLSTKDIHSETIALERILKNRFRDNHIPVVNTERSNEVSVWDIEVLKHFLANLKKTGDLFLIDYNQM